MNINPISSQKNLQHFSARLRFRSRSFFLRSIIIFKRFFYAAVNVANAPHTFCRHGCSAFDFSFTGCLLCSGIIFGTKAPQVGEFFFIPILMGGDRTDIWHENNFLGNWFCLCRSKEKWK